MAEQQFTSQEIDTVARRKAVSDLAKTSIANIDQIPAKQLLEINKGSLSTILQMNQQLKEGKAPTGQAPREVKLLAAAREQVGPEGDIMESDIVKLMMVGKGREKSRADIRQTVQNSLQRADPTWLFKSAEERKRLLDEEVENVLGPETPTADIEKIPEPAKRTKALIDATKEAFKKELTFELGGGRLSQ